jgi:U3 small nucleolar ribonucleoprotein protein LCP5
MKKSDAKRRARDEEDLTLGGDLGSGSTSRGRRRAGGLEDEFDGVLRSVSRVSGGHSQADGMKNCGEKVEKWTFLNAVITVQRSVMLWAPTMTN